MTNPTEKDLADARKILDAVDNVELVAIADHLATAASAVLHELKLTPGGDAYVYQGNMSKVEWLRDLVERFEELIMEVDLEPDDDEPDDEET